MSKVSEFFTHDMLIAVGFFIVGHMLGWFAGNAQFVWEFWKDKPVILRQAKKWDYTKLKKVKKIILDTEVSMKTKMNNYNSVVLKNLLIKIFSIANTTS